ncbi:hypothetical protein BC332_09815 [Capsicum chinense]|nr:hypothetical protein BC332_09815 [Capsicum chinense]
MSMVGKTKDTLKSRYDLVDLGIRQSLHRIDDGDNIWLPTACFTFSSEEKLKLCDFLANLKVPNAFASNISRCVNVLEKRINGLKCHDHHVLLQDILPVVIHGLLPKEVCEPIISRFYLRADDLSGISSATLPVLLHQFSSLLLQFP